MISCRVSFDVADSVTEKKGSAIHMLKAGAKPRVASAKKRVVFEPQPIGNYDKKQKMPPGHMFRSPLAADPRENLSMATPAKKAEFDL